MDDARDFGRIVEAHYAPLYRFAVSLCRHEGDACDLVQETFRIWAEKGHQLADITKVKSWLFTTLHRLHLAGQRRVVRFPHYELSEVETELPEVPPELPARLDWQVLLDCLAQVDETYRAPVVLFYLEDISYQEIARMLEIPLGTVKSRLSRGMGQLERIVTARLGGGELGREAIA